MKHLIVSIRGAHVEVSLDDNAATFDDIRDKLEDIIYERVKWRIEDDQELNK